jgi:hypothetical protein
MMNVILDADAEYEKWKDMPELIAAARERLLVVSAGNPRRRVQDVANVAQVKLGNVHHHMCRQLNDVLG